MGTPGGEEWAGFASGPVGFTCRRSVGAERFCADLPHGHQEKKSFFGLVIRVRLVARGGFRDASVRGMDPSKKYIGSDLRCGWVQPARISRINIS